jgi:rfaE bifunctional protein nucleotidyltransferase chain/domain/rfaE bifunctional protein kinase chain/domain
VVVVGDAMLDVDLSGRASRLSPDAPVPVLDDLDERARPGGAALAAALAARSASDVVLVAAITPDDDGRRLTELAEEAGVEVVAVPRPGQTVVKRRVRSAGQSLVRLDSGSGGPVAPTEQVAAVLRAARAVLVADYGQGFLEHPALREALEAAGRQGPLVWDPHPRGSGPVPGARLVTPNADEAARAAADVPVSGLSAMATTNAHALRLLERWRAQAVAVTLGERGALLTHGQEAPSLFPAPRVHAGDPCGAGDQFAAAATVALSEGALTPEAVQEAVQAAAGFVAAGGAGAWSASGTVTAADPVRAVREQGGTVVATGGCFDLLHAGHVATLEAARALGDCLVVCVNSDASVRRLKGSGRPVVTEQDRIRVLQALSCVDAVLMFDEDTPVDALRRLRPDVWAKGGDYSGSDLPEAPLVASWGGQTVVLPYLEGRSTTRLVSTVVSRGVATR